MKLDVDEKEVLESKRKRENSRSQNCARCYRRERVKVRR